MRLISLLSVVVLSGCSSFPLFIEDLDEMIQSDHRIIHEIHHNERTVLCCSQSCIECDQNAIDFIEKHREKMKQFEDYYWYHFGKVIA